MRTLVGGCEEGAVGGRAYVRDGVSWTFGCDGAVAVCLRASGGAYEG